MVSYAGNDKAKRIA